MSDVLPANAINVDVDAKGGESVIMTEVCEALVAGLGKLKRMQLGWEDKGGLLGMVWSSGAGRK